MNENDFTAIAKVFADTRPKVTQSDNCNDLMWLASFNQWRKSVDAMVDMLQIQNARFIYNLFRRQCDE